MGVKGIIHRRWRHGWSSGHRWLPARWGRVRAENIRWGSNRPWLIVNRTRVINVTTHITIKAQWYDSNFLPPPTWSIKNSWGNLKECSSSCSNVNQLVLVLGLTFCFCFSLIGNCQMFYLSALFFTHLVVSTRLVSELWTQNVKKVKLVLVSMIVSDTLIHLGFCNFLLFFTVCKYNAVGSS